MKEDTMRKSLHDMFSGGYNRYKLRQCIYALGEHQKSLKLQIGFDQLHHIPKLSSHSSGG